MMVIEVPLVICHFRVTLWPAVIEVGFAEKMTVGTGGGGILTELPPPQANRANIQNNRMMKARRRNVFRLIALAQTPFRVPISDAPAGERVGFEGERRGSAGQGI